RLELDLVERVQVRRVADGDVKALAPLQDGKDAMFRQQLVVDETHDVEVSLDRVQIQKGNAELVSGSHGDLPGGRQAIFDEVRYERAALLALDSLQSGQQIFLRNDPVLYKTARQPGQGSLGCNGGHWPLSD